ncbi:MAG: hypothetical protein KDC00_14720 [Flavobacteriales bacterium]|nr:hypothetical protein [Flavobacteriales bacterium]
MPIRIEQFLRTPLDGFATEVDTIHNGHGKSVRINTIEAAIHILGGATLSKKDLNQLYDFMDSAATFYFRQGTPIYPLSGNMVTTATETLLHREIVGGFVYVLIDLDCVRDGRQSNAEDLVRMRTDILLEPKQHLDATNEMSMLRKRFIYDERDRKRRDHAITREMRRAARGLSKDVR